MNIYEYLCMFMNIVNIWACQLDLATPLHHWAMTVLLERAKNAPWAAPMVAEHAMDLHQLLGDVPYRPRHEHELEGPAKRSPPAYTAGWSSPRWRSAT